MNREKVESVLEDYRSEKSEIRLISLLKDKIIQEMENFSTEDSDANEHKLNMLIREFEEDLDRIENEKLGDWDPERK